MKHATFDCRFIAMGVWVQSILGAFVGFTTVLYSRGIMKQPAFFRPYEHVLGLSLGGLAGYKYHYWTQRQGELLIRALEAKQINSGMIREMLPKL